MTWKESDLYRLHTEASLTVPDLDEAGKEGEQRRKRLGSESSKELSPEKIRTIGVLLNLTLYRLEAFGLPEAADEIRDTVFSLQERGLMPEFPENDSETEIAPARTERKDRGMTLAQDFVTNYEYLLERISPQTKKLIELLQSLGAGRLDDEMKLSELSSMYFLDKAPQVWKEMLPALAIPQRTVFARARNSIMRSEDYKGFTLGDLRRKVSVDELMGLRELKVNGVALLAFGFEKTDVPKPQS